MVQQLSWLSAIVAVLFSTFLIDNQLVATLKLGTEATQHHLQNILYDIDNDYKSATNIRPFRHLGYEFLSTQPTLPSYTSASVSSPSPTFEVTETETEASTRNEPDLEENSRHIRETKRKVKRKINILGNRSIQGLFNVLFRKENDENLGKRVGHRSHSTRSFQTDFFGSEFLGKRSIRNGNLNDNFGNKDQILLSLNKGELGRNIIGKRVLGAEFPLEYNGEPEFSGKNALEAEFLKKRSLGAEFLGKRALGAEFLGKRAQKAEFLGKRAQKAEFLGKRDQGAEFLEERMVRPEILRKKALGAEFLGKRAQGAEFLEEKMVRPEILRKKALGAEFLGKRALREELLGERLLRPEFLRKRALGAEFLGKRAIGQLLGEKVLGPEFFGRKALGEELLGTRAFGPEFSRKRALGSEFLGKRSVGAEYLEKRALGPELIGKRTLDSGFPDNPNTMHKILNNFNVYPRNAEKNAVTGSELAHNPLMDSTIWGLNLLKE